MEERSKTSRHSTWLVVPVHGREGLTSICLEQKLSLAGVEVLVVGDDANLGTARALGFHTLERPNVLGRKINDGIEYACRAGADYVAYVGSDNWTHASFLSDPTPGRVRTAPRVAYVSPDGKRLIVMHVAGPLGSAPWLMPRAVLARVGFRPARESAMSGIDMSIADALLPNFLRERKPARYTFFDNRPADDLRYVGFKVGHEIHGWSALSPNGAIVRRGNPWEVLATRYPAELVSRMEEFYA